MCIQVIYSFYDIVMIFFIYSVIGWLTEVVYAFALHGKFVNRGFLKGPVCPIYGFGIVVTVLCLTPVENFLPALFIGSVILTTLLELGTGYILERFFKTRWWDYSDRHFNYHGYICLSFSLLWGLACVFVVDVIQPVIMIAINKISHKIGLIIICISALFMLADLVTTLVSMIDMTKSIDKFEKMQKRLELLQDNMREKAAEINEKLSEQHSEYEILKEKATQFSGEMREKYKRLFDAFPHVETSGRLVKFKSSFEEYIKKSKK